MIPCPLLDWRAFKSKYQSFLAFIPVKYAHVVIGRQKTVELMNIQVTNGTATIQILSTELQAS